MSNQSASSTHLITVALRMAGIAGQDKLSGIFEYVNLGRRWQLSIYRSAQEFTGETVLHELSRGAEGFIVGLPDAHDAFAQLSKVEVPTVLMVPCQAEMAKRDSGVAVVLSDSREVDQVAAAEMLHRGSFKSYGYAGYRTDEPWSVERGRAFRDALEKAGRLGRMFDLSHYPDGIDDRATMVGWLQSLPKPCGIFASCDDRAYDILSVCREAGIRVPGEVGLLGVNNDPILCENAEPRLSSVQPDFICEGRQAAELMDRMLASPVFRAHQQRTVYLVGVRQVVQRDSLNAIPEAGILVQNAVAFIERNALKGIGVQDVARHLNVSYSLLNLRFQAVRHESVYTMILRLRMAAVERLLVKTNYKLDRIAAECGWSSVASLRRIFLKFHHLSTSRWRAEERRKKVTEKGRTSS